MTDLPYDGIMCQVYMQGSAADVCKAAMVALHGRLSTMFPTRPAACRLILQVRDLGAHAGSVLQEREKVVTQRLHWILLPLLQHGNTFRAVASKTLGDCGLTVLVPSQCGPEEHVMTLRQRAPLLSALCFADS